MSSTSEQYTTVEIVRTGSAYDAIWMRDGSVMERTSYQTLAAAEMQAKSLLIRGIAYRPPAVAPARGGYDRTASQTPDPGHIDDIEHPMPGLLEEEPAPVEEPQDPQAAAIEQLTQAAIDAGHDRIRVLKAVDLVTDGHVFDLRFGGEWVVFSEQADMNRDDLWTWTPGTGKTPPAKRYITSPQPEEGQHICNCPDSWRRVDSHAGKCKHWLAAVIAANLRKRLNDDTLFAVGSEGYWTHVQSGAHLGIAGKGELPESMTGYNPGLNAEVTAQAVPA